MTVTAIPRTDVEEDVHNGATWLDEHMPDWRDQVDKDRLDMQNACDCVLGQLLGNFYDLTKIGLTYHQAYNMGFETTSNDGYAALTEAWRQELA